VQRTTLDRIRDVAWHLVLPVATYTAGTLAALSRYARTGVIDVIRADYVRTARAKGLAEPVVIVKHAVRNGMIPILTLLASCSPCRSVERRHRGDLQHPGRGCSLRCHHHWDYT
jgi:ABC-type dipeptide/oligopeptide/nickel transport system permease component